MTLQNTALTIQSFTQDLAILTSEISALVLVLAGLSYAIGIALMSNAATHIVPSLAEHGQKIKMESIKALFHIAIYSGIANAVVWGATLINSIGD